MAKDKEAKDKERDRITLDLKGLRERLETAAVEPGQSMSSVVRRVAHLGLDLLEACQRLKIPPPVLGELEKWLIEISGINQDLQTSLSALISQLSVDDIADSEISFDRLLAIKKGAKPEPHEIMKLSRLLNKEPGEIQKLLKDKNKCTNGNTH